MGILKGLVRTLWYYENRAWYIYACMHSWAFTVEQPV